MAKMPVVMPWLLGCLALAFPRLVLLLVWLFGGSYIERAYGGLLWPLLGFLFLPLTTLAFAYANNAMATGGELPALGWLITAIALLMDVGILGGQRRRRAPRS